MADAAVDVSQTGGSYPGHAPWIHLGPLVEACATRQTRMHSRSQPSQRSRQEQRWGRLVARSEGRLSDHLVRICNGRSSPSARWTLATAPWRQRGSKVDLYALSSTRGHQVAANRKPEGMREAGERITRCRVHHLYGRRLRSRASPGHGQGHDHGCGWNRSAFSWTLSICDLVYIILPSSVDSSSYVPYSITQAVYIGKVSVQTVNSCLIQ